MKIWLPLQLVENFTTKHDAENKQIQICQSVGDYKDVFSKNSMASLGYN